MASNNNRLSPRQKMINLMYIVLTAMLALNVSSDVLNGFKQVEDGLERSTSNASLQNDALYQKLAAFNSQNPEKGGQWYKKSLDVKRETSQLYNYIDSLKTLIVKKADGKDGDVNNIERQDDLEAASYIMLSPAQRQGAKLRKMIDEYRTLISGFMTDSVKRATIENYLSTSIHSRNTRVHTPSLWETTMFENMPVIAAVTILTKIQSDVRYAESEALHTLINNIDEGDVRVNQLNAFVIPNSKNIMRGGKYSANIVLAAIDTTQRPAIYINGQRLPDENKGLYETYCGSTGIFDFQGYLEVPRGDGSMTRHEFSSSYTVVEPSATISATLMNVLYAGIGNPISISVPGIPNHAIQATMTNGTLTRQGDNWIAKPAKVGQEAVITVTATMDGRSQTVANTQFRVRQLPDPMPYIAYKDDKGYEQKYKGGKPFPKTRLLAAPGIQAAIDDDLLNVSYRVLQFETVFFDSMGNAIPEVSDGANFSQRQKNSFRRLSRGKRFYISRVRAVGPDGIERDLSPIEVIVN
ncbi:gliding motility protein GldM [Barnesiella viscericola]|uniref:type IX secretion system motor protein PorM/GldM n=1 Tax=Barnesiella viscericola TaxID=397865 RepID=UPI00255B839C|nr:gliding motility protein GldM [Barnesiella viscericola]